MCYLADSSLFSITDEKNSDQHESVLLLVLSRRVLASHMRISILKVPPPEWGDTNKNPEVKIYIYIFERSTSNSFAQALLAKASWTRTKTYTLFNPYQFTSSIPNYGHKLFFTFFTDFFPTCDLLYKLWCCVGIIAGCAQEKNRQYGGIYIHFT